MSKARILLLDIETAPMLGYVWKLWDENIGLNQLQRDWYILAFAAKWAGDKKIHYMDQRSVKNPEDDKLLVQTLATIINQAHVIVTFNGKRFDEKKINARCVLNGIKPPSKPRHIDVFRIAKKHFGFTSNSLDYLTGKLCKKHKKRKSKKFPGFELWSECLKGNMSAWREMEKYNKMDVLSLEELWGILKPWDSSINFSVYDNNIPTNCHCGGKFTKNGFEYGPSTRYQRHRCGKCGTEVRDRQNLLAKGQRDALKVGTRR